MFRDRGVGWPSVGDQYGSRGKMQMTNQHSGALLRGRKGKGGNKGTNTCSLFVCFDILTCLIRNLMFSMPLFLYFKCFSLIDVCNALIWRGWVLLMILCRT